MSHFLTRRLALLLCGLTLLLLGSMVFLARLNDSDLLLIGTSVLTTALSAALVGGLIASRRPANPVGWFIAAFALCFTLGEFTRQYAIYGLLTRPGALPFARLVASPPYWIWFPGVILLFVFLPLYFPNGQLVSPRWRPVVWLTVVVMVLLPALAAIQPGDGETPGIPNPLGIPLAEEWISKVEPLGLVSWLSLGVAAAISLVLRFRRASGEERQQIKWFTYAVTLVVCYSLIEQLLLPDRLPFLLDEILSVAVFESLWVALAVSVLRYRLYDIDIIIRRTLVYSMLTVALALIYFGSVVLLQSLITAVGGQQPTAAIVLSTLVIAALFSPLRRRVQAIIDHRFYRRKYDAQKTLTAFAATTRDEVDLNKLTRRLLETVEETVQPGHVSLWLRQDGTARSHTRPGEARE